MDNQFLSAKLSGGMNKEDGVVLCVTSTKSQPLLSKSGCVAVLAPKACLLEAYPGILCTSS